MDRSLFPVCASLQKAVLRLFPNRMRDRGLTRIHYGQGYLFAPFYERIVDEYKAELYKRMGKHP